MAPRSRPNRSASAPPPSSNVPFTCNTPPCNNVEVTTTRETHTRTAHQAKMNLPGYGLLIRNLSGYFTCPHRECGFESSIPATLRSHHLAHTQALQQMHDARPGSLAQGAAPSIVLPDPKPPMPDQPHSRIDNAATQWPASSTSDGAQDLIINGPILPPFSYLHPASKAQITSLDWCKRFGLRYYPELRAMLCTSPDCQGVMVGPRLPVIVKHCQSHAAGMTKVEKQQLLEHIAPLPLVSLLLDPSQISTLAFGIPPTPAPFPFDFIPPPTSGYQCDQCFSIRPTEKAIKAHIRCPDSTCTAFSLARIQQIRYYAPHQNTSGGRMANYMFRVIGNQPFYNERLAIDTTEEYSADPASLQDRDWKTELWLGFLQKKAKEDTEAATIMRYSTARIDEGPWQQAHGWARMLSGVDLAQLHLASMIDKPRAVSDIHSSFTVRIVDHCTSLVLKRWRDHYAGYSGLFGDQGLQRGYIPHTVTMVSEDPPRKGFYVRHDTFHNYSKTWKRLIHLVFHNRSIESPIFTLDLTPEMNAVVEEVMKEVDLLREDDRAPQDIESDNLSILRIQELILDLGESFIKQSNIFGTNQVVLARFAGVLGITAQGTLHHPAQYSPVIAGLLYMMRFIFIISTLRPYVRGDTLLPHPNLHEEFKAKHVQFMRHSSPHPISEILMLIATSKKLGKDSGGNPIFYLDPLDHDCITYLVTSQRFHFSQVTTMVLESVLAAKRAMTVACLVESYSQIPTIGANNLVDSFNNAVPGYSFLTEPKNQSILSRPKNFILHRIVHNEDLCKRFLDSPNHLSQSTARSHLKLVENAKKHILLALHLTGGNLSRSTEISGLRWRNSPHGLRTVIVVGNDVMCIVGHNKTDNVRTSKTYVIHVGTPDVSELILQLMTVLWPLEELLLNTLHAAIPPPTFLFSRIVNGEEIILENIMSDLIRHISEENLGVRLTLRPLRQLYTYLIRDRLGHQAKKADSALEARDYDDDDDDEVDEDPLEAQAGHRITTARNHYGLDFHASDLRGIGTTLMVTMAEASYLVQGALRLRNLPEQSSITSVKRKELASPQDHQEARPLKHSHSESAFLGPPPPLNRATPSFLHPNLQLDLRNILSTLYPTTMACKNTQQYDTLSRMISGVNPLLAVHGTGTGKSIIIHVSALMPSSHVTIVVIPLRAVLDGQLETAKHHGIDAAEFTGNPSSVSHCRLVFILSDLIGSTAADHYLQSLCREGRLTRIIVDECHLYIMHQQFRACVYEAHMLGRIGVPLVFLTATLPPSWESRLARQFGVQSLCVARSDTQRTNIRLAVEHYRPGLEGCATMEAYLGKRIKMARDEYPADLVVVFVRAVSVARSLASTLSCPSYTGDLDHQQRQLALLEFESAHLIIATTALGAGVDFPNIRYVFHYGASFGAIEELQEGGRAGRDGKLAHSITILDSIPDIAEVHRRPALTELDQNEKARDAFYGSTRACRREALSGFVDGYEQPCWSASTFTLCDVCEQYRKPELLSTVNEAVLSLARSIPAPLPPTTSLSTLVPIIPAKPPLTVSSSEQMRKGAALIRLLKQLSKADITYCFYCWITGKTASDALSHTLASCKSAKPTAFSTDASTCEGCWMPSSYCGARCNPPIKKTEACERSGICLFGNFVPLMIAALLANPQVHAALTIIHGPDQSTSQDQLFQYLTATSVHTFMSHTSIRGLDYLASFAIENEAAMNLISVQAQPTHQEVAYEGMSEIYMEGLRNLDEMLGI